MPLYEYICGECGARVEVRQGFEDPPLEKHEGCGGELSRVLSIPTFQFKGSGFYATDYRKGEHQSAQDR